MNASRNMFILAFGSNSTADVRSNAQTIGDAVARFLDTSLKIVKLSRRWRTPAFPPGSGPDFANACALAEGALTPDAVLEILHRIEADMGRVRGARWAQRVIDIDLLAAGDAVLPDPATWRQWHDLTPEAQQSLTPDRLILPHPRIQDRAFVLVPMAEVAGDWRHPVLDRTVSQMLAALDPALRDEIVTI